MSHKNRDLIIRQAEHTVKEINELVQASLRLKTLSFDTWSNHKIKQLVVEFLTLVETSKIKK